MQGRYAHFRHDFKHALGDGLTVSRNYIVIVLDVSDVVEFTLIQTVPQRFKGKVGIDRVGAVAHK